MEGPPGLEMLGAQFALRRRSEPLHEAKLPSCSSEVGGCLGTGQQEGRWKYLSVAAVTKKQRQVQVLGFGKEQQRMGCPAPGNIELSSRAKISWSLCMYDSGIYKLCQCIPHTSL